MAKAYLLTISEVRTKNIVVFVDGDQLAYDAVQLANRLANDGHINMDKTPGHHYDIQLKSRANDRDIITLSCYDKNGECLG